MKNMNELITAEAKLYHDVLAKRVDIDTAREANNAAGKIIAACVVQVNYSVAREEKPSIPFLKPSCK